MQAFDECFLIRLLNGFLEGKAVPPLARIVLEYYVFADAGESRCIVCVFLVMLPVEQIGIINGEFRLRYLDLIHHENLIQLVGKLLHLDRKLEVLSENGLGVHVLGLVPQITDKVPVERLNTFGVHLLVEDPE